MQEPLPGHRRCRRRCRPRSARACAPVDPVPGLVGTVDLGDLGSVLDAAREGDESGWRSVRGGLGLVGALARRTPVAYGRTGCCGRREHGAGQARRLLGGSLRAGAK